MNRDYSYSGCKFKMTNLVPESEVQSAIQVERTSHPAAKLQMLTLSSHQSPFFYE